MIDEKKLLNFMVALEEAGAEYIDFETLKKFIDEEEKNTGWIYCGDGENLPEFGKRYQITAVWEDEYFEKRTVYDAVYGSNGVWYEHDYKPVSYEVIAWQPLPEPYHED